MRMKFALVVVFLGLLLTGIANEAAAQQKSIAVMMWGVGWTDVFREASAAFEKETGIKVIEVTQGTSGEGLVKLQAMKARPTIDVWFTTSSVATRAVKDRELFAALPSTDIANWGDVLPDAKTPDWVAAWYYPFSIIYRPELVSKPITRWEDLWDPAFKNKLAIPNMMMYQARLLLTAALLNGGSEKNVDPGFEALKRLRPNVALIYGSDAQARQVLSQGEAAVLLASSAHAKRLRDQGINVVHISPKPTPMLFDVMTLVKTGNAALGAKFIDFALRKETQELISRRMNMGPVNRKAAPAAALVASLPKAGDGVAFDEEVVNQNIGAWTERFNREIAK